MRWTPIYFGAKPARAPQNENKVPIKVLKPLSLANSVKMVRQKNMEDKCLLELTMLLNCWRTNNFDNKICKKCIDALDVCNKKFLKATAAQKKLQQIDIPPPNSTKLTSNQMNYLLRMYPTV